MQNVDQVIQILRSKKYKITPQRMAILKILEGNKSHPSAEGVFKTLIKTHPSISFTTVYNTLETLTALGQIKELTIDAQRKHYDPDTSIHHHVMCTGCGAIEDVFVDYTKHLKLPDEVEKMFEIHGHQVQFYGLCSECQDKKKQGAA